jgi:hypothetical protein
MIRDCERYHTGRREAFQRSAESLLTWYPFGLRRVRDARDRLIVEARRLSPVHEHEHGSKQDQEPYESNSGERKKLRISRRFAGDHHFILG